MFEFTTQEQLFNLEVHLDIRKSIEDDLKKCRERLDLQPIWVIAERNNKKPMVVRKTQVKQWSEWLGV